MFSARKFSTAIPVGHNSNVEILSDKILFTSSGIFILNERSPASTCTTGICNLTAAKAPAKVELVSP